MVYVGVGAGLLLFRVVYRRRVPKVAKVEHGFEDGGPSAPDIVEYLCQPFFCLATRLCARQGSRGSIVWGVKSPVVISVCCA